MAGGEMTRFLTLLFCGLCSPGWAAITIDAITTAEGMNNGDISTSHTGAADASHALACVTERDSTVTGLGTGPTVTYGGNAMTLVPGATQTQSTRMKASLFYYASPPSGSQTVAMTRSTNSNRYLMTVITIKGAALVDTFNTAGTFGSDSATNIDLDGLASAVGELAVLCGAIQTNTPAVSPDATAPVSTEQVEQDHTDSIGLTHFVYTENGAATSINMRIDATSGSYTSVVGVSIRSETSGIGPLRRRS